MKRRSRLILRYVLSIMLLIVVAAWVRSEWRSDSIMWTNSKRFIHLISTGGRLILTEQQWDHGTASPPGWSATFGSGPSAWGASDAGYGRRRFAGFEWSETTWWGHASENVVRSFHIPPYRVIGVPYWFIAALLSLPFVRALLSSLRRRRRLAQQLCPDCGYDLRGSPERCPECGAAASTVPRTSHPPATRLLESAIMGRSTDSAPVRAAFIPQEPSDPRR